MELVNLLLLSPLMFLLIGCGFLIYAICTDLFEVGFFEMFEYENPSKRICKLCGSTQVLDGGSWWEDTCPSGNNPNCFCHKLI